MPKSKVRKKPESSVRVASTPSSAERATAPSPTWWPVLMASVLVIGLAYLVVYYLQNGHIGFMNSLGGWNFAVGFGIMIVGLGMAVRWR